MMLFRSVFLAATVYLNVVDALAPTLTSSAIPTDPRLKRTKDPSAAPTLRPSFPPTLYDPELQSFGLDCSIGRLDLYFDSIISAPSLNIFQRLPSSHGYIGIYLFHHLHPTPVHPLQTISNNNTLNSNNTIFSMSTPFTKKADLIKQGNTSHLILYLSADDFALLALSLKLSVAPSSSFVYLSIDGGVVLSSNELHGNKPIPFDAPLPLILQPSSTQDAGVGFSPDTLPPYLVQFSLDMNIQTSATYNASLPIYGILTLVFSEPMDVTPGKILLTGLTLQSTKTYNSGTVYFNLVDDIYNSSISLETADGLYTHYYSFLEGSLNLQRTVVFALGSDNMNGLKSVTGLCVTHASCYLSGYKNSFAHDVSYNNISLIGFDKYNPVKVSVYNPDVTAPTLLYWTFNSNTARITLVFSEAVYMIFFKYSSILLLNGKSANISDPKVAYIRVTNPVDSTSLDLNTDTVQFTLNTAQQFEIKSLPSFMRTVNDSYLYLEDAVVMDTSFAQNVRNSELSYFLY